VRDPHTPRGGWRRDFPEIELEPDTIFVRQGSIYTSGGVTAGMDLALALMEAEGDPPDTLVSEALPGDVEAPVDDEQLEAVLQVETETEEEPKAPKRSLADLAGVSAAATAAYSVASTESPVDDADTAGEAWSTTELGGDSINTAAVGAADASTIDGGARLAAAGTQASSAALAATRAAPPRKRRRVIDRFTRTSPSAGRPRTHRDGSAPA